MRVDELERELRAERMEPDAEFARGLDEWAAAGFPPRREPRQLARLRTRFAARPPRRLLLTAGAVATVVVVSAVAISRYDSGDLANAPGAPGGGAVQDRGVAAGPAGEAAQSPPSGGAADEYELALPRSAEAASGAAASADTKEITPAHRKIAQRVDLSLATAPADFRDAADSVLDVVADHRGFVVSSSVSGGDPTVRGAQPGQAEFRLKIPANQLPAALAALSDLGHVISRTDGTEDITGRFVGAKQRIAELSKARQNLLAQLEDAFTETEQQSIRARLRIVQAQLEDAQGDLAAAQQRVSMVPVGVRISADATLARDRDSGEGGWSLSDALHDAGDVLTALAGGALVTLAALLPLALAGLLLWWGAARIQRQRRETALD
jgi:hypothetical protein